MILTQKHAVIHPLMALHVVKVGLGTRVVVCEHRRGTTGTANTGNNHGRGTVGQGAPPTKDSVTLGDPGNTDGLAQSSPARNTGHHLNNTTIDIEHYGQRHRKHGPGVETLRFEFVGDLSERN